MESCDQVRGEQASIGTTLTDLNAMTVAQASEMTYDADGMKLTDKLTGGGSSRALTQYSYDSEHRLQCAAVRMNSAVWGSLPSSACTLGTAGSFGPDRITKTIRDANGRPTEIKAAFGVSGEEASERTLGYSANGQVTHLIDANVNRTTYEYDGHDRLIKTRFPITTIGSNSSSTTDYEQLTLDANGNVTNRRLRDAQNIGYTYDALNRLTAKNLPGSEPDATYAYDLLNRMTSAVQNSLTSSMTWDALGRMLTEATTGLGTVTSEYDLAGRRTKVTLPGSTSLYADYLYDVLGNVTFIRENGATSGVGVLATYQYDSLSRRSSVTFGNGVVQGYTYDNAARLATQTNDLASTANDLTQTFSYNPASQISSVTRSNDLYAWTGHSNVNLSSTPNGLNQIGNVGASTVTHDSKGNITAVGASSYGYSSENLLTSGPSSATLAYDPLMRLYQVTQGGSTTRMGYDGTDRIAEYDGSNAVLRRYVHGPGVDNPIVAYEGTGTTSRSFLSSDERGSIISLTDSSGTLSNINKYDEYGIPQSTNVGAFGYTGQIRISQIKAWYYKARTYLDEAGRFMQTDPIGYEDSPNLYAYVGNDPLNLVDPLGLAGLPNVDSGTVACHPNDICVTGKRKPQPAPGFGLVSGNMAALSRSGSGGKIGGAAGAARNSICPNSNSAAGQVAEIAESVAQAADAVAVASGTLGILTAPTGAGGALFGGAALIAGGVGRIATGVGILANLANGNEIAAAQGALAFVGGTATGVATRGIVGRSLASRRMFGDLSAGQQRVARVSGEGAAAAAGRTLFRRRGC